MQKDCILNWTDFYKKSAEFELELSLPGELLVNNIINAINEFKNGKVKETINNLMTLKKFIMDNIKPEALNPEFVLVFLGDDDIWDWVESVSKREPNKYDADAAKFVIEELSYLLNTDKIFAEES